jgi:hypothetical protein
MANPWDFPDPGFGGFPNSPQKRALRSVARAWDAAAPGVVDSSWAEKLKTLLDMIVLADEEYELRLVLDAMAAARHAGYAVGIRVDQEYPEWPVVYIQLPTGQVSWHMPEHPWEWDGHTTPEKFDRIAAFRGVGGHAARAAAGGEAAAERSLVESRRRGLDGRRSPAPTRRAGRAAERVPTRDDRDAPPRERVDVRSDWRLLASPRPRVRDKPRSAGCCRMADRARG